MSSFAVVSDPDNPYPGLRPYDVDEFDSFFGRDRQIDELLVRLRDHRFVAVVGLSGSGKSSLVRAGLIHKLQVGHLGSAGSRWRVALLRPGSKPLEALAAALDDELGQIPARTETLRQSTHALLHSTKQGREPEESLLLVIDQFEEIFRYQREKNLIPREAAHFVDLLLAAEQDLSPDYRVYVVLTMRSDALGEAAQFEGLPEVLNRCQYLVPRMTRDQMREAIEGPAALTDTEIALDLLQALLTEAAESDDHLPLLQHLLMMLWTRRQFSVEGGWQITSAHFEALGGLTKALNDHADQVLAELVPNARQDLARRIFRQLTESGEGRERRRPARLGRLAELTAEDQAEVTAVVEHFFRANFFTSPDRASTADWEVDITHECLIRQWTKLREWAKAEAVDREEYRYFSTRAVRGGNLLAGTDLDLALRWLDKKHTLAWAERHGGGFGATVDFIQSSRAAREEAEREAETARKAAEERAAEDVRREQKRRRDHMVATISLLFAVAVAGLAVYAFAQRDTLASQVEINRWQNLVREATAAAAQHADDRAALLARQAFLFYASTPDPARRRSVEDALLSTSTARAASRALVGHTEPVIAMAWQNGGLLASGSGDTTLRVWKVNEVNASPIVLTDHTGAVNSLAFSANGALLASGSDDDTVRLWNTLRLLQPQPSSADRRRTDGSSVALRGHEGDVNSVAFSPDGRRLASASDDRTIRIWDLTQPDAPAIRVLNGHTNAVYSVAFSPVDADLLASASWDDTVRVWDLRQPDPTPLVFGDHTSDVNSVAFSPDGTLLASGSDDRTIRVRNLKQPNDPPIELKGHQDFVFSVAFSPDGTRLASGSRDDTVRVWDLRHLGVGPMILEASGGDANSVLFSPGDGATLAVGDDANMIRLWDLSRTNLLRPLYGHTDFVVSVAFSRDGTRLASASWDDTIRVWKLDQTGEPPIVLTGHRDNVNSVVFSPTDRRLASASDDGTVRLWDPEQPCAPPVDFKGHTDLVNAVAFSPDGTHLASGSDDRTVRVWNVRQPNAPSIVFEGHQDVVYSVAFSPDGTRLVSGSFDDTLRVWDLRQSNAPALVFTGHKADVNAVAFSADGDRLASGSDDRTIRVWNSRRPDALPIVLEGHGDTVYSVAFSPDGTLLASGSFDDTARLWDLNQGPDALPVVIGGHRLDVNSVAFSPDGKRLASGSDDMTIRIRDLWIGAADLICRLVARNLSADEWRAYVGTDVEHQKTCPRLP